MIRQPFILDGRRSGVRGLVGLWGPGPAGGGTLFDMSGMGRHGATAGTTEWAADGERRAIIPVFDGTLNRHFVVSDPTIRDLPLTYNFAVCFWCLRDNVGTEHAALAWSGTDDLLIYPNDNVEGSGGTRVYWRDLGGTIINETGPDLSVEWHHHAWVSSASNAHRSYRDGVSIGTSGASGTAGPFSEFQIGTFDTQELEGRLNDVRVYNRALSVAEIQHIFQKTRAVPYSDIAMQPRQVFKAAAAPGGTVNPFSMGAINPLCGKLAS